MQLPQLTQQVVFITVLYAKQHPRQVKLGITVPAGSPISSVRQQLFSDTSIQADQIVLAEINNSGFSKIFYDYQPCSLLNQLDSLYCIEMLDVKENHNQKNATTGMSLMLLVVNLDVSDKSRSIKFGMPFCIEVDRDYSYMELQKKLLREMSAILKPEVFSYKTPLQEMFRIRLQDPSADPGTYLENVEHPLFTEIIDIALSLASSEAGPQHIKLLLEWDHPELFFHDLSDHIVEHESVPRLKNSKPELNLSLEQCLEHYTKAETLSLEDAWRCPHCQKYLPVVKKLGLWSLPDILVIHLKRFRQHQEKGPNAAKLTTMVQFPLNDFDMSPHLANRSYDSFNSSSCQQNTFPWKKKRNRGFIGNKDTDKDTLFNLYAVCYHQGDTLETGHYTAACKSPYDQEWYKFDDQKVSKINSKNIEADIVNNDAYILFYQRNNKHDLHETSDINNCTSNHWITKIAQPQNPQVTTQPCQNIQEEFPKKVIINIKPEIVKSSLNSLETITVETEQSDLIIDVENVEENRTDKEVKTVFVEVEMNKIETQIVTNLDPEITTSTKPEKCSEQNHTDDDTSNSTSDDEDHIPLQTSSSASAIHRNVNPSIPPLSRPHRLVHSMDSNYATITSVASNRLREAFSESLKSNRGILASTVANRAFNSSSHCINLRHSFSTNSTISSILRNNSSTCSKDTLIFIDQHHGLMNSHDESDDDVILVNRALWVSYNLFKYKLTYVYLF